MPVAFQAADARAHAAITPPTAAKMEDEVASLVSATYSAYFAWRLGVLHRVVSLGGSLVLGLGFVGGHLNAEQLFSNAFLDELWQNEKWGRDQEARNRQDKIRAELREARRFLHFLPDMPKAKE